MMSRRDWWLGVAAVVLAILLHAALPRYEWRALPPDPNGRFSGVMRLDRWTGRAEQMFPWRVGVGWGTKADVSGK